MNINFSLFEGVSAMYVFIIMISFDFLNMVFVHSLITEKKLGLNLVSGHR